MYWAGLKLGDKDSKNLVFVYAVWANLILEGSPLGQQVLGQNYDIARHLSLSNVWRFYRQLLRLDASVVFSELKKMRELFRRGCYLPKRKVKRLARQLECSTDGPIYQLLGPLMLNTLCSDSEDWYRYLNTVLNFPLKIQLGSTPELSEQLEAELLEGYLEDEKHNIAEDLNPSSELTLLLQELSTHVERLWRRWEPTLRKPEHGPGATAEVQRHKGTLAKYAALSLNEQYAFVLQSYGFFGEDEEVCVYSREERNPFVFSKLNAPWGRMRKYPGLSGEYETCLPRDATPCVLSSVPKNAEKRRGISFEATWRAHAQKIVATDQRDYMARNADFHCDLHDQSHNQRWAQIGSATGRFVTGDLSSASDLVRNSVIMKLTEANPLLQWMWCETRATHVLLPDGTKLELSKFAPMGSATCFPAMCTLLSAVIYVACAKTGAPMIFWVYGDDIIVPVEAWPLVCHYLELLGLKVNYEKSYSTGYFRESCGGEYVNGYDITPLRISQLFDPAAIVARRKGRPLQLVRNASHYEGLCALANRCQLYGFTRTAKQLRRAVRAVYPLVAFSGNWENGLYSPAKVRNSHLKCKLRPFADESSEIPYVRTYVCSTQITDVSDDLRYALWLEYAQFRPVDYQPTPEDRGSIHDGEATTSLRVAWVPAFTFEGEDSQS